MPSPRKASTVPASASPSAVDRFERLLMRAILHVRDQKPKLLKSGGVSRVFVTRLAAAIADEHGRQGPSAASVSDTENAVHFAVGIARSLGLVVEQEGALILDSFAADRFFSHTASERLAALRKAWLDSSEINEFFWVSTLEIPASRRGHTVDGVDAVPGTERMMRVRSRLVTVLEALPTEAAIPLADLLEQVQRQAEDILVPRVKTAVPLARDYVGVRVRGGREDIPREGNWLIVEGALIELLLRLPMTMLGYLEVHDKEAGAVVCVHDSRSERSEGGPFAAQPLMVQANFEVMALLPEMEMRTLWSLARLCSITDFGQVARFTIEERHVADAIHTGLECEQVLAFLESHSKSALPQNVRYSLVEWGKRTERMTIWLDAVVFEAEGVEDLSRIVREEFRTSSKLQALGSRHLIGSSQDCPQPGQGIAARYPVLNYMRNLPAVVMAQADGSLVCAHEQLNFRVMQTLSRIAERQSIERWSITRASVQQALQTGTNWESLCQLLASITKNELPVPLRVRMLAWAGRFGAIAASSTRIVQFASAESAALLRQIPEAEDLLAQPLNATCFHVSEYMERELRGVLTGLSLEVEDKAELDLGEVVGGEPAQLARVLRAPASRLAAFAPERFSALWSNSPLMAIEYAVMYGAALSITLADGRPDERRLQIEPRTFIKLHDGACLEALRRDDGRRQYFSVSDIASAQPL